MNKPDAIPKRPLGKTGAEVTILGLGGEGILRTFGQEEEAVPLIHRALDLGITYFETARAYSGSESYYGMALGERRKEIFLASNLMNEPWVGLRNNSRQPSETSGPIIWTSGWFMM